MRSKTMAIMAAAVLFLPTIAHAQPSEGSAASWTFTVLTIWNENNPKVNITSNIKREPYGVFTSQDDCDMARAKKVVELDSDNLRLPHKTRDAEVVITRRPGGDSTEQKTGPTEKMYVTGCTAEKLKFFTPARETAQNN